MEQAANAIYESKRAKEGAIPLDCIICGKPSENLNLLICPECLKNRHTHANGLWQYLCYRKNCDRPKS